MIKWLALAILAAFISTAAFAAEKKETLASFPVCKSLHALRNLTRYMAEDDKIATKSLFDSKDCRMLEGGVTVYLIQRMGRLVQIRIQGENRTVWTVKEAIE